MSSRLSKIFVGVCILGLWPWAAGCGGAVSVFNPAFVNQVQGGQFPLTPGPNAAFLFVRVINETNEVAEFSVTIEREVLTFDDAGNAQIDDQGNPITRTERETVRLTTTPDAPANELGVTFSCAESPINLVGLGDNLAPTDSAVFIGGQGAAGAPGVGIPASSVPPLSREAGHFSCGDTVIFRAAVSPGVPGGVALESRLLPGSEQPSDFTGPNTFVNLEELLQSQVREEEP